MKRSERYNIQRCVHVMGAEVRAVLRHTNVGKDKYGHIAYNSAIESEARPKVLREMFLLEDRKLRTVMWVSQGVAVKSMGQKLFKRVMRGVNVERIDERVLRSAADSEER